MAESHHIQNPLLLANKTTTYKSTIYGILVFLILYFIPILCGNLMAQDVSKATRDFKSRLKENPLKITGSIQANTLLNAISGMPMRRDPFNLNLFGHLNLDLLGIKAPLSIAFADGNTTYRLPSYSFVGISPSYRWVKLHLFRRNMQFSKYTLSGHGFNGVGIELAPGKFRLMSMYGTLRKARLEDYGFRQELDPFYKRKGYAVRAGYKNENDQIFATIFKAEDDDRSLIVDDSLDIQPQENMVISLDGKKQLSESLSVSAEYAHSILTTNIKSPRRNAIGLENIFEPFGQIKSTSKSSQAFNFNVDFSPLEKWSLDLEYERVNPNFTSLGTLQFRNDFENLSLGYRGFFKKQIAIVGRIGIERNNLDDLEIESRNRFLYMMQINIPIEERWQNNISYSNFRQTTRLIDNSNPFEPVDSIFLGSVNNQFGLSSTYTITEDQRLLLNISHQRANSIINDQISRATSKVNNYALNYYYNPQGERYSAGGTLYYTALKQEKIKTSALTPAISLNYLVNQKLSAYFTASTHFSKINSRGNGSTKRVVLGGRYIIVKNQKLSLRLQYINRSGAITNNFSEVNGQIGYGLRF